MVFKAAPFVVLIAMLLAGGCASRQSAPAPAGLGALAEGKVQYSTAPHGRRLLATP